MITEPQRADCLRERARLPVVRAVAAAAAAAVVAGGAAASDAWREARREA